MFDERNILKEKVLELSNQKEFQRDLAMEIFQYQYHSNSIYQDFCNQLHREPQQVKTLRDIPFLPISFFKTHRIQSGSQQAKLLFQSSGTSGMTRSQHWVPDEELYQKNALNSFERFYGPLANYTIFALLPSYMEQGNSSLIYMVKHFIHQSDGGFFLKDYVSLQNQIQKAQQQGKKVLLWGVSYALLDLIEHPDFQPIENLIVMETGGMKGRRKEIVKEELHKTLCQGFGVEHIHSEYGMTELLSQAYSLGKGIFESPSTMKILIRDSNDPLSMENMGRSGGINVIDLANLDSCAFIATQDLGKLHSETKFEVLGRFDNSDVRGCNLMVE